jgi:hypothetical protein
VSIPIRLLEYSRAWNIGDEIQTQAVRQHLDEIDGYVDRDHLDEVGGDPFALVMQGWYAKRFETFPPASAVRPVWVGFHLSYHAVDMLKQPGVRDYLAASGPIGCRDEYTASVLADHGIDAFVSGCMTTTFPLRTGPPAEGKVYLVDTVGIPIPEHLRHGAVRMTHQGAHWWSQDAKRMLARDVLAEYRDHARLVVTTRLHCALPCVAMGIPVVFVGDPTDERLTPIRDLAEIIPFPDELRSERMSNRMKRKARWWREMKALPWTGLAADIEDRKAYRIKLLLDGLEKVGASVAGRESSDSE